MDTRLLIEEYIANGGTITKLPAGTAEGALDLGRKDAIGYNKGPKAIEGHEEAQGVKEFN